MSFDLHEILYETTKLVMLLEKYRLIFYQDPARSGMKYHGKSRIIIHVWK